MGVRVSWQILGRMNRADCAHELSRMRWRRRERGGDGGDGATALRAVRFTERAAARAHPLFSPRPAPSHSKPVAVLARGSRLSLSLSSACCCGLLLTYLVGRDLTRLRPSSPSLPKARLLAILALRVGICSPGLALLSFLRFAQELETPARRMNPLAAGRFRCSSTCVRHGGPIATDGAGVCSPAPGTQSSLRLLELRPADYEAGRSAAGTQGMPCGRRRLC